MARPFKDKTMNTQVSVRLEPEDYKNFNRLCHMEFSQMAPMARMLILEWMEKKGKKAK